MVVVVRFLHRQVCLIPTFRRNAITVFMVTVSLNFGWIRQHFSINLNQIQSPWMWRYYVLSKRQNNWNILRGVGTQKTTITGRKADVKTLKKVTS